ncbi:unnamed protein product [Didymodactylos carnosus]|uniref:Uncharacterized protein n=1 Tax=Didymodactylos carnosus TaxID=1234261 RepID=A0A8S2DB63_9BILA|nr:unnamed protein product [Didymodactylos carnosus]CAF3643614.1 unnamed protein product [Didymodactylos carnosus]
MHRSQYKSLNNLKRRNDIVIKQADKGQGTVVTSREVYEAKTYALSEDKRAMRNFLRIQHWIKTGNIPKEYVSRIRLRGRPKLQRFYILPKNDELAQFVHCNQTEGRKDTSTAINTVNVASPSLSILTANMTTNIGYVQKKSISCQTEAIIEEKNMNNQRRNSSSQSRIVTTTNDILVWDGVGCPTDMSLDMYNEAVWKNPTEEIVEGFRLYREWWLTTDCGVKIHNIKCIKKHFVANGMDIVTTEEDTLDVYRQEYERFYRFRNHLAINRYYAENNIIPCTFNFEIPVQTFGAKDPLLRKRWEHIASNMRKTFLQCEADAIQKTIDETRLKLETLREKILKMKKEQQMLDIERGTSEFLSDFSEKAWNNIFRLEMKEIAPNYVSIYIDNVQENSKIR